MGLDSVSGGSAVFTALPHHQQSVSQSVGVEAGRDRVLVVPGSGTILSVLAFLQVRQNSKPHLRASMTAPLSDVPLDEVGLFLLQSQHDVTMSRE